MVRVFQHREAALLISGQAISSFGDGVAAVSLNLLVLSLVRKHLSLIGLFGAARMVPMVVFVLFGGVIVDRFSRKTLMLISDSTRALIIGGIAVLTATGHLHYWELVVMSVLFGAFDAVFFPASTALVPQIVEAEMLPAMAAMRPLTNNLLGNFLGPSIGALIYIASPGWALGVDAMTFVISATALALMKPTPKPVRVEKTPMTKDIREGMTYVRRTPWMWTTLVVVTFGNGLLFTPLFTFLPAFIRHTLHAPKIYVGLVMAASGIAGALGAIVIGSRPAPRRRVRAMWGWWILSTFGAFALASAVNVYMIFIIPFLMSPTLLMGNTIWETMLQAEVPTELMGRVSSVDWFLSLALTPVGLSVAGLMIQAFGIRGYFAGMGALILLTEVATALSPTVNRIDANRLAAIPPAPTSEPSVGES